MKAGALPIAIDTSVLLAALLSWHERHAAALAALDQLLAGSVEVILPLPALVEAYSVMTRLPAPHRLRPEDAARILVSSLRGRVRLATLDEAQGWGFIERLQMVRIAGGRTYDAHIAACAAAYGARRLVTLNARDFSAVAPDLDVIVP